MPAVHQALVDFIENHQGKLRGGEQVVLRMNRTTEGDVLFDYYLDDGGQSPVLNTDDEVLLYVNVTLILESGTTEDRGDYHYNKWAFRDWFKLLYQFLRETGFDAVWVNSDSGFSEETNRYTMRWTVRIRDYESLGEYVVAHDYIDLRG